MAQENASWLTERAPIREAEVIVKGGRRSIRVFSGMKGASLAAGRSAGMVAVREVDIDRGLGGSDTMGRRTVDSSEGQQVLSSSRE
ncbi:hypothetical protein [Nocardia farcinica]|uniref:hypothetical protein n=1 Tax=Nocardia farcinica TaxID=37329 RepID=UPI001895FAA2|nr:hypothetical protein [Nocardia farcinica]MBF6387981.1 hypothetical protein [Nocardia farcinica]